MQTAHSLVADWVHKARGYYRPELDCMMFTRTERFCRVCRRAIERVVDLYTRG